MLGKKHKLVFQTLEPIVWSLDHGGFIKRSYRLTINGTSLISSKNIHPNKTEPSSIHSGELVIDTHTVNNIALGANTSRILKTKKRDKHSVEPGHPIGIVIPSEYSKKLGVQEGSVSPYNLIQTTLYINFTKDFDDLIANNYDKFIREGEINIPAALILYYKKRATRSYATGIINIQLDTKSSGGKLERLPYSNQASTSRKYTFANDIFEEVSNVNYHEKRTYAISGLRPSKDYQPLSVHGAFAGNIQDISFVSNGKEAIVSIPNTSVDGIHGRIGSGQFGPNAVAAYRMSPQLTLRAFGKYTGEVLTYTEKVSSLVYIRNTSSYIGQHKGIRAYTTLNKGLTVAPRALSIVDGSGRPQRSLPLNAKAIRVRVSGDNVGLITPTLHVYAYKAAHTDGSADTESSLILLNMQASEFIRRVDDLEKNVKSFDFALSDVFLSSLDRVHNSGMLSFSVKYKDPNGDEIEIASPDTTVYYSNGYDRPYVSSLNIPSVHSEWAMHGHGIGKFDKVCVEVFYDSKVIGGPSAESYEVDARNATVSTSSVAFKISPSSSLINYLSAGRTATVRACLKRNDLEIYGTSSIAIMYGIKSGKRKLHGVELMGNGIVHGRDIEIVVPNKVKRVGELIGYMFREGERPRDILSLTDRSNLNSDGLVGTVSFGTATRNDNSGRFHIRGTPTITHDATGVEFVDLVVLERNHPSDGSFIRYCLIKSVPLYRKYLADNGFIQSTIQHPWNGWWPYDFYIYGATYSDDITSSWGYPQVSVYPVTTGSETIGSAFIDFKHHVTSSGFSDGAVEYTWELVGGRLVDTEFVKKNGRRYHGNAVISYNFSDPLSASNTASVYIAREPCIENISSGNLDLSHYVTISGYGFSGAGYSTMSDNGIPMFTSCVNGVTYYDMATKVSVSDLPYATTVLKHTDGREEFAVKLTGAAPTQLNTSSGLLERSGYVVLTTDHGSDWYKINLKARTSSQANYYAGDPDLRKNFTTFNRGVFRKLYMNNMYQWGTGALRSNIHLQDALSGPTKIQGMDNYVKPYLEYSGSDIADIFYMPMSWSTSFSTYTGSAFSSGTFFITLEALSVSFTSSYYVTASWGGTSYITLPKKAGISIHPGTGKYGAVRWTSNNFATPSTFKTLTYTFSGAAITSSQGFRATHRTDYYDIDAQMSSVSSMFSTTAYAFSTSNTSSGIQMLPTDPNYSRSNAGGICHINSRVGNTSSNYTRFYAIDEFSTEMLSTMSANGYTVFDQLGSNGSKAWGLTERSNNYSSGRFYSYNSDAAMPGATNVPWGLFSIDKEPKTINGKLTKRNRAAFFMTKLGKPKVSVQGSSQSFNFGPYIRFDTPIESVVRPPYTSDLYRDVVDGNAVSHMWGNSSQYAGTGVSSFESLTPLIFNVNPGTAHYGLNGQTSNVLRAKVEFLDSINPFSTEDPLNANEYERGSQVQHSVYGNVDIDASIRDNNGWLEIDYKGGMLRGFDGIAFGRISGVVPTIIRESRTDSGKTYSDEVYGTAIRRWDPTRFYSYPLRAIVYSETSYTTISQKQHIGMFSGDSLEINRGYSTIPTSKTVSMVAWNTILSNTLDLYSGSVDRSGTSYDMTLLNGLRTSPRGDNDLTFPYLPGSGGVRDLEVITGDRSGRIQPSTGILHDTEQLVNGNATVIVNPFAGHEYGFLEKLYKNVGDIAPEDAFYTNGTAYWPINLNPAMRLDDDLVENNASNILTGIRKGTDRVKLVLIARVYDGSTMPIVDLERNASNIRFVPKYMGDFFSEGDKVRVGVQYDSGSIDVSDTVYRVYNISATVNTESVSVYFETLASSVDSVVVKFAVNSDEPMQFIGASIPLLMQGKLSDEINISGFLTSNVLASETYQYVRCVTGAVQKSYLTNGQRLNAVGITESGRHLITKNNPIALNGPRREDLGKSAIKFDSYPSPRFAPSYYDSTSGTTSVHRNNPKAINYDYLFWSESVTYSKINESGTVSGVKYVSWPEAIGYGAGLRISGKDFILRKDEFDPFSPYLIDQPGVIHNIETYLPGRIYTSDSATFSNTYFSYPSNPGNGYRDVSPTGFATAKFVNKAWFRPIYSQNANRHTASSQTEWQEVALEISGGKFRETPPPIVYGGIAIRATNVSSPGYPKFDAIDDTNVASLKYVNLDNYWVLYTPTPVVDSMYRYNGSGTHSDILYGSDHDIWPKSISRSSGQAVIRVSGHNLVGNLNYKYNTSSGTRRFDNLEPVKVYLHHTPSNTYLYATSSVSHSLWGGENGNNSSRVYALFEIKTSSMVYDEASYTTLSSDVTSITSSTYFPNGHYDFYIETKWAANELIYTLSTTVSNAVYITSSVHAEIIDPRVNFLPNVTHDDWTISNGSYTTSIALSNRVRPMMYAMVANYPLSSNSKYSTLLPYNPVIGNDIVESKKATGYTMSLTVFKPGTGHDSGNHLTMSTYEVSLPMAKNWGMFDEFFALDADIRSNKTNRSNVIPVVFADPASVGARTSWISSSNAWLHYQPKDLWGSAADVDEGTGSLGSYHSLLNAQTWDYGLSYTGSGAPYVANNDITITSSRGAYAWRSGLSYSSYLMPRIVSVAGVSADNVVNSYNGRANGLGDPRIDIILEDQGYRTYPVHNTMSQLGDIFRPEGIALTHGSGGQLYIPIGSSSYGKLIYAKHGLNHLLSFIPNNTFKDLLGNLRTAGWLDVSVVYDSRNNFVSSAFRTLRVAWTPWDVPATTGDTVAANPISQDGTLYCLRMLEKNGELRAAFGVNFGGSTYDVSHQEPLIYDKDFNDDWFVLIGSARYDKNNNSSKIVLYGSREKDMYIDMDQGDVRGFSKPTNHNLLTNGDFNE